MGSFFLTFILIWLVVGFTLETISTMHKTKQKDYICAINMRELKIQEPFRFLYTTFNFKEFKMHKVNLDVEIKNESIKINDYNMFPTKYTGSSGGIVRDIIINRTHICRILKSNFTDDILIMNPSVDIDVNGLYKILKRYNKILDEKDYKEQLRLEKDSKIKII